MYSMLSKRQIVPAAYVLAAGFGVALSVLGTDTRTLGSLVLNLVSTGAISLLVLLWCVLDARERGGELSYGFRAFIVVLAIPALIVHLVLTRQGVDRVQALIAAIGLLFGFAVTAMVASTLAAATGLAAKP